jgi:FkbM family methyltransferase
MVRHINRLIRNFLNKFGYEIVKNKNLSDDFSVGSWITRLNISTIIDIGSNEGQFIQSIDNILPGKKIIAFEPIKSVYETLVANTRHLNITTYNMGLSDQNGTSEINISKNLVSSSLLNMEELHKQAYPESAYINKEVIELRKLDDVVKIADLQKRILIKIDVQGYENKVIAGAKNTIAAADVIIIEFSYQPIYEGQWLFHETYSYFTSNGFKFIGLADQVTNVGIGVPIFGDAIFVKETIANGIYH